MGKVNLVSLSMNLQRVTSLNRLSLHVLVEQASEGHFIASVPELPDCVAEAETRSDAFPFGVAVRVASLTREGIAAVQEQVRVRLANIEVLTLEVANNPWTDFIGMFEGDDEFATLAQELRTERELDKNSTV
jgi:hypothetical protein